MQNALNIKRISAASIEAAEICCLLDEVQVEFVTVDSHCWAAEYPYKPKMEVRVAHNGKQLLVNYRVTEECVRAVAPHDDGNVWEDSCCEFFLSPVADGSYYNIECNAAGTLLIGFGKGRDDRKRATKDILDTVDRWASMGRAPFTDIRGAEVQCRQYLQPHPLWHNRWLRGLDTRRGCAVHWCGWFLFAHWLRLGAPCHL